MDPALYNLLEPAVIFATLLGTLFGVKLIIWGKGPMRRLRRAEADPALMERIAELEERLAQSDEVIAHQAALLDEVIERVDFAERMLTRQRNDRPLGLEGPSGAAD
jgi:hypothetical protein